MKSWWKCLLSHRWSDWKTFYECAGGNSRVGKRRSCYRCGQVEERTVAR